MTKLDKHFAKIGACAEGRAWVAANCSTAAECWEKLLDEGRVDWALWWYSKERGFDTRVRFLTKRIVLRAARVHAAAAMAKAGLHEQAKVLREIPDTASFEEIRKVCRSAYAAYAAAYAYTADAAAYAADAAAYAYAAAAAYAAYAAAYAAYAAAYVDTAAAVAARKAERAQQIADIREILTCPWTETKETP